MVVSRPSYFFLHSYRPRHAFPQGAFIFIAVNVFFSWLFEITKTTLVEFDM